MKMSYFKKGLTFYKLYHLCIVCHICDRLVVLHSLYVVSLMNSIGHSSPRRWTGEKKMPAIIIKQQFGFAISTT